MYLLKNILNVSIRIPYDKNVIGVLQNFKWESAMSIDKHSFGFRRNANLSQYLTSKELIAFVVKTVSCGGRLF